MSLLRRGVLVTTVLWGRSHSPDPVKTYSKTFTRLGVSAVPRQKYGSFDGKTAVTGRVMSSLAGYGGLAGKGGIAGIGGGLAA